MAKLSKSDILKNNLINALEKTLGVVTPACKKCDCSRDTFYRYVKEDPLFEKRVISINDIALDFAESQLHKRIRDGSDTATIFYLKTQGKKRGYIERQEIDNSGEVTVNSKIDLSNLSFDEIRELATGNNKGSKD